MGTTHLSGSKTGVVPPLSANIRSEEHTSELQSLTNLVCRLLLEKKKQKINTSLIRTYQHTTAYYTRQGR